MKNEIRNSSNRVLALKYNLAVILSFLILIALLDALWLGNVGARQEDERLQLVFALIDHNIKQNPLDLKSLNDTLEPLGYPVRKIDASHDLDNSSSSAAIVETIIGSEKFWLACPQPLKGCALIGPIVANSSNPAWPTVLFYGLLAAFFIIWLHPIFSGLSALIETADGFARKPANTSSANSIAYPVKPLAEHFDQMATRIVNLMATQQDITRGLSHELRTPIARIKFALASINSELDSDAELLRSIAADTDELEAITKLLLDYARLEELNTLTNLQPIPCEELVDNLEHNNTSQKRISTSITIETEELTCDPTLMRLALNNIVKNAYFYAHSSILISTHKTSKHYSVIVKDDGDGIPAKQLGSAHLPFSKGDNSQGFGFGLAFTDKILKLHKGSMIISSSRLNGCKVVLSWPTKKPTN